MCVTSQSPELWEISFYSFWFLQATTVYCRTKQINICLCHSNCYFGINVYCKGTCFMFIVYFFLYSTTWVFLLSTFIEAQAYINITAILRQLSIFWLKIKSVGFHNNDDMSSSLIFLINLLVEYLWFLCITTLLGYTASSCVFVRKHTVSCSGGAGVTAYIDLFMKATIF